MHRVILLPGGILPADLAYGALVDALGDEVAAVAKDLELYAGDKPPGDYSLDHEVAGVVREADARGWERFHLVGYSGGGAAALAAAARHPDRLLSLALLEPAWAGNWDLSEAERAMRREFEKLDALTPDEFMAAFVRLGLRPGVTPPTPASGPSPPWMAKRPAGIAHSRAHSGRTTSTESPCAGSTAPSTTPLAVSAIPTCTERSPSGSPESSTTSLWRYSRSDTTSIHPIESSRNDSFVRCAQSGSVPKPPLDRLPPRARAAVEPRRRGTNAKATGSSAARAPCSGTAVRRDVSVKTPFRRLRAGERRPFAGPQQAPRRPTR